MSRLPLKPGGEIVDTAAYARLVQQASASDLLGLLALWRVFAADTDSSCHFGLELLREQAAELSHKYWPGLWKAEEMHFESLNRAFFRRDLRHCPPDELAQSLQMLCDRFFYTRLPLFRLKPIQGEAGVELQPEWACFYREHGRLLSALIETRLQVLEWEQNPGQTLTLQELSTGIPGTEADSVES